MYSEVAFNTHDQASFRDFVITNTDHASRVFPGVSFGSAFSFANSNAVGKRFIIWRAQDNKLELIDLCFEQELHNNCIRIYFPRHLIPAVSVIEYSGDNDSDGYVCVFVLTAGRTLHRFVFPHPANLLRDQATRHHSIFESITIRDIDAFNTSIPLSLRRSSPSETPSHFAASSPTHVSVSCGSLIFLVRLTDPSITHFSSRAAGKLEAAETEYPAYGLIKSYLPLMRRSQPTVLGLALVENYADPDDPLVFALSAYKLHVYSKRINMDYSLNEDGDELPGEISDGMLRLSASAGPKGVDLRVVAARFRDENTETAEILTFIGRHEYPDTLKIERSDCKHLESNCVIDFSVGTPAQEFTWVLCTNEFNQPAVLCIPYKVNTPEEGNTDSDFDQVTMSKTTTRSWSEALILQKEEQLPDAIPNTIDVNNFYWDILHRYGQFDRHIIADALTTLDPPRDRELKAPLHKYSFSALHEEALKIVRRVIDEEVEEEGYDPMSHAAVVWSRLWTYCVKQWEAANTPIGLHIDVEAGLYLLIRRSTVGLFRRTFPIECVAFSSPNSDEEGAEEGRFYQDADVDNLWKCCSFVLDELGSERFARLDCDLAQDIDINELGSEFTEMLIESSTNPESHFYTKFKRLFHAINDPVEAAKRLINIINAQPPIEDDKRKYTRIEFKNACGLASVAGSAQQQADANFRVSCGLFLTLALASRLGTDLHIPPPALAALSPGVYNMAARMTRLHYAFSWLLIQPFHPINTRYAPVESQFINLSLGSSQPQQLVAGYIKATWFTVPPSQIHDASHIVSLAGRQLCASLDLDTPVDHPFIDYLVRNEQWITIEKLVQRLKGLQPNPERGLGMVLESKLLADLKGCALLHTGKYEAASETLANVAAGITEDEGIARRIIGDHYFSEGMNTVPSQRGQPLFPAALKWFYCLRVASMFEAHRQYHHAEKFYMIALPQDIDDAYAGGQHNAAVKGEIAAIAWSCFHKIFQMRISDPPEFELAYQAITAYPNFPQSTRSQDAIKHLVSLMCDAGKAGVAALQRIHFVGKGVVRTVASPRLADIPSDLATPLNYYTVLYSFLVTRDNFREAAKCMYEYGQRITTQQPNEKDISSSPSYLSQTSPSQDKRRAPQNPYFYQSQAYLIAINALKIVDTNFQWIEIESQEKPQATKRKRSDTTPSTVVTIVSLADIEKAYTLATAHAFLWNSSNNNPKQGLLVRGAGPNIQDTFTMLIATENYRLAFDFAGRFSLDPKPILETLAERCGKDGHFAVTTGWNLLKTWLDTYDAVPTRNDISPSRLQEIIKERATRTEQQDEDDNTNPAGTVYPLMGTLEDSITHENTLDHQQRADPLYFARISDLNTFIDVRLRAPISASSIRIGQQVLVYVRLVAGQEAPAQVTDAMEEDTQGKHVTAQALRVVPLRQNSAHAYHALVADRLLQANPRMVLPVWLVRWFADSELAYSELLQVYLANHRLEDACFVALDIIEKATQQVRKSQQTLLPYTLLDNLFSVLEDNADKQRLDKELNGYFNLLDQPA